MKKVKLPRAPDMKQHPLLSLVPYAARNGTSLRRIAIDKLGIRQQSLHGQMVMARKDRNYLVPAMQVPVISVMLDIEPYYFNPVLWPNLKWKFK